MTPLRVLLVEDTEDDALLVLHELERGGYAVTAERVETAAAMRAALERTTWDLVISDYSLPELTAPEALDVLKATGLDLPFIIVSGTLDEEAAVDALRRGAHDFLSKRRRARLLPAVARELREAESRRRRREAEESLRASEERFRTLVASMDDLVLTYDPAGRFDGVFGRALATLDLDEAAVIGRTAEEALANGVGGEHAAAFARALAGEHVHYDWSRPVAGRVRWFQTILSPRRDSAGRVAGGVFVGRDTTTARQVQAQLAVADRMVSVGMLAAGIAHEINNPMASLLVNIELAHEAIARARPTEGTSDLVEILRDSLAASHRIRDIVRDLRLFSREETAVSAVDVHGVIESSLRMAANELRHRARIERDLRPVPRVDASESRLGQVVLNLLVNAGQAIGEGNADHHRIRVATSLDDAGRVVIEVTDTGSGMPPEVLERLFTPFFTTKPSGIGTGLGLSICHRIVTSLGGAITVTSQVGQGSTFRVVLPASTLAPAAPAPARAVAPPAVAAPAARARVLIVDDERMVGEAIRRMLPDHEVTPVLSAAAALQRVRAGERYDVVLCDLMMPQMTGMELHAELTAVAPEQAQRMVFLTGGAFTPGAREFLADVTNPTVSKPFDRATIRETIARQIAGKRP